MSWWMQKAVAKAEADPKRRAVAYYRHSAEIGQENSVEIQQDNVRAFAAKHSLEIIHEFADRGKSGLNAEGRPAFTEMMQWVQNRDDFRLVLVLNVSRWGRFQDTDLSAHYESLCTQKGKQVVYVSIGFPRDEDKLVTQVRKSLDRYQSAELSYTLSKTVFDGAAKVASQGYRPGASPPYGCYRLMLDERKEPDRILQPGQRKAIQNGRIVLVPGEPGQVQVVQEIFTLFAERGFDERQIAGQLNSRGLPAPNGGRWSDGIVRRILNNQQYAGAVVYNRTRQKLKSKKRRNPREQWIVTPDAYEPVVPPALYEKAQAIYQERRRRFTPEHMLAKLRAIYEKYSVVTSRLLHADPECLSPHTYAHRFGGLAGAFQAMFPEVRDRVRGEVAEAIGQGAQSVDAYEDFLVINQGFTVLIQPSVAVPDGYGAFWTFRPDRRPTVDITLGVPLSAGEHRILGYLALPRLLVPDRCVRLSAASDARIELHGYNGLDLIRDLAQ